jgi:hypothetical protein
MCRYMVATPIGNLEDITLRALRVLRAADAVYCEDTRHTARLLNYYGIKSKLLSAHAHNESTRVDGMLARVRDGQRLAVVSDAGVPMVSDPGWWPPPWKPACAWCVITPLIPRRQQLAITCHLEVSSRTHQRLAAPRG